jgi:hypothetical protein
VEKKPQTAVTGEAAVVKMERLENYATDELSTIHDTLRAGRRRLIIQILARQTEGTPQHHPRENRVSNTDQTEQIPVAVRQLAKEIVAVENDVSPMKATGKPYHSVYTALIQTHLPKLHTVGAIRYNDDRKEVVPDRNLLALAIIASNTSSTTKFLFYEPIDDERTGTSELIGNSTSN